MPKSVRGAGGSLFEEFYPPFERWVEVHAYPSGEGLSVYLQDIASRRQVEEALLNQFKQISAIFDSVNALVYVADISTHELLFINAYGANLFGEDCLGKACYAVLQSDQGGPCAFCTNDQLIQNGLPQAPYVWEFQNTVTGKWFLCIDKAIPWIDGRLVRLEIAVDISDRKEMERERERLLLSLAAEQAWLEAVLHQMPAGVIIAEAPSRKVVLGNEQVEHILRQPLAGNPAAEQHFSWKAFHPTGRLYSDDEWPLSRSIGEGDTVVGEEIDFERGDKTRGIMRASSAPIRDRDGRIVAAVMVFDDITELREVQRRREEMLELIAHDIRHPLTVLRLCTDTMRRGLERGEIDRMKKSIEVLDVSAKQLDAMICDLVDSARFETGQFQLEREPVEIGQFLREMLARSAQALAKGRVKVEVSEPLTPFADPHGLERVLTNLLSNALKYSDPGTEVTVRVRAQDDAALVSVIDRGHGIASEDLPHLFDRGFRAEGTRKVEGLGLGLYISRLLVEAQGGRILAESEPGKGSVFYFTLPLTA